MTGARLNLLVLRTRQQERLRLFYSSLGIAFTAERHGNGPEHFAGRTGQVLLELYPLGDEMPVDTTTRLGFAVPDVAATVETLLANGGTLVSGPRQTEWGVGAVVRDPDGRAVELVQG